MSAFLKILEREKRLILKSSMKPIAKARRLQAINRVIAAYRRHSEGEENDQRQHQPSDALQLRQDRGD